MLVGGEENAGGADELRHDDAFGTVDDEGGALGHPGVITEIDVLLLDFASNLIGQLHHDVQRGSVGREVVFGGFLVFLGGLKIVIFEA